jgi:hypothetical protein
LRKAVSRDKDASVGVKDFVPLQVFGNSWCVKYFLHGCARFA